MHLEAVHEIVVAEPSREFQDTAELLDAIVQRLRVGFVFESRELQNGVIQHSHLEVLRIEQSRFHGIHSGMPRAHDERSWPGFPSVERSGVKGDS